MKRHQILKRSSDIRRFILGKIGENPKGITASVVKEFKISRQAAARYLAQMVKQGQVETRGTTKGRSYSLGKPKRLVKEYDLKGPLDESRIWTQDFKPLCDGLKPNVLSLCAYGFTEMVNNAIDHSKGKMLTIGFERKPQEIFMSVQDDGVGIFRKIKDAFHLADERQAILELSKGKLTTDPARHTGEGIFFTSRIFDDFAIRSHEISYTHLEMDDDDWLLHNRETKEGTLVLMQIKANSRRKTKDVFDQFSNPDNNYSFDKTVVQVRLAQDEGGDLISRSQAKRLMLRVENFRKVVLDFEGVQTVGPAFADEIFRVYRKEHPKVEISSVNASSEISKMIQRARGPV